MKSTLLILLVALICFSPPKVYGSKGEKPDADKIIEHVDELYRTESSYSEIEMEIVTPHWKRNLTMRVWTEGMNKTFIRITSPPKEKGIGTLRIKKQMWNYLPKVNKVIKIPPSMMMSSWMGSDFTNDDLVDEFTYKNDFTYRMIAPDSLSTDFYYVECIPKEDRPIVWGKIVMAVTKKDWLPVWENYYDEKGNLIRVLEFKDVRKFGDRTIPALMVMKPMKKRGHRTTIRYLRAEFNCKLEKDIFTLRHLRSH